MIQNYFNYIIPINNEKIFKKNFTYTDDTYILQRGYDNIPRAYNDGIHNCDKEYICLIHQDVYLPDDWEKKVEGQIEKIKGDWGVLGVAGVALRNDEKLYLGHIRDRGCGWGSPDNLPTEVDTLDELLLIIKNDGELFFDEGTKNHFYGADICTQAKLQNKKCYAIDAYCHHNSIHGGELLPDFWESCQYMKDKYKGMLPIATTCTVVQ